MNGNNAPKQGLDFNIYPTHGTNWEALLRVIGRCQRDSISVVLLASPYLPSFREGITNYNRDFANFRATIPSDVEMFDFTNTLTSNDYFADHLHINKKGASLLLQQMIEAQVFEK